MQTLSARFIVNCSLLAAQPVLVQVTTGVQGEVLALSANRNPLDLPPEPSYAYAVASWRDDIVEILRLEDVPLRIAFVQSIDDGKLILASPFRGNGSGANNALVVDRDGKVSERLSLGGGVQTVQKSASSLWVGYSDEGIFKYTGISRDGLVHLDRNFQPIFRFNRSARGHGFPLMYDCYALNVASSGDVFTYYYSAKEYFPLAHIRDDHIVQIWPIQHLLGAYAFAIAESRLLLAGAYRNPQRLTLLDLQTDISDEAIAVDGEGNVLTFAEQSRYEIHSPTVWGRGDTLYLLDERGVWAVAVPT